MIQVICGEDNVASRNFLNEIIEKFKKENFEIQKIASSEIVEIGSFADSPNLFGLRKIFVIENLNKTIKKGSKVNEILEKYQENKDLEILIWEDELAKRELKIKVGKIKEFRPQKNIFNLLDASYPSNLKEFLTLLDAQATAQNEIFILTMLSRHIRSLLLVKEGTVSVTLQAWQVGKLKRQASFWTLEKLIAFYDGLYKIDSGLKTGKNPYGIKKSLDILACYLLK